MTRNEYQLQDRGVLTPIFSYSKENIAILKSVQRKSYNISLRFLVNQKILPPQFSMYNQIVIIFNPDMLIMKAKRFVMLSNPGFWQRWKTWRIDVKKKILIHAIFNHLWLTNKNLITFNRDIDNGRY